MSGVITNVFSILKGFIGFTRNFDTVAKAKADRFLRVGQKISIDERYSAVFEVVLTSDVVPDGYGVIERNNGFNTSLAIRTTAANIKQFGAVGIGVTDDTLAIQAAVNHAFNAGKGGEVSIHDGVFLFTKLTIPRHVKISGISNRASILKCVGTGAYAIDFEIKAFPDNCKGIVLSDFAIISQGGVGSGVRWVGVSRSKTENLRIEGFSVDGFYLDSPLENEGFSSSYYNSHFNLQTANNGVNLHFGNAGHWESGNSNFFYGGLCNLATGVRGCIHMEGHANNVLISGMTVEALPNSYHIYHEGTGGGNAYDSCRFENTGSGGIVKVTATAKDTTFKGCLLSGDVDFVNDSLSTTVIGGTGFGHWHISERAKPLHLGGTAIEMQSLPLQSDDTPIYALYDDSNKERFALLAGGGLRVTSDSSKPSINTKGLLDAESRFQVIGSSLFLGDGVASPFEVFSYYAPNVVQCSQDLRIKDDKYLRLGPSFLWVDGSGKLRILNSKPVNRETDGVLVGAQG